MNESPSEDLFHVTLSSIGDAVVATDFEGRVTFLNRVAEKLTGWPISEAMGQPLSTIFRIVNEHTREPVENPVEKVFRLGEIVGLANHTILISRDGTEWPIDDSAAPIRGTDGRLRGVVLVFREITERKQAEEAAAERHRITAMRADVATALALPQPLQTGLQACCEALVRHLRIAFTRIWTSQEAEGVLELQASAGQYTHLDGPDSRIRLGDFKIGQIAATRQPHLTNEVQQDPTISDPVWAKREGMRAFAGYPLLVDERVVGVLAIFSRNVLTEAVLEDLAPLVDQIAQHILRKQNEERLRESELRYRLIGQAANDAIWDWDLVTNQVIWNEGVQARFGFTPEQIGPNASWWVDHIHPEDRDRVTHGIHEVIDGNNEFWQEEYRFQRADESYANVFDRGRVVRNEQGQPLRMVGSMLDMTERKWATEALRESNERVRLAVEAGEIGTWDFDPIRGDLIWSDRCKAIFGLSPEDAISYEIFLDRLHPEDRERAHQAVQQSIDPGGSGYYEIEYRSLWPDGTVRLIIAKGQGLFAGEGVDRHVIRFIGIVRDVTEQRQAEERLRFQLDLTKSITDNATTAIFMMDEQSRCTFMNPAAEQMTGYSFSEVEGSILHEFIHHHHPDGRPYPISECPLDRALPNGIEVRNHEDLFFRKNGESFPVLCNARVIFREGQAIGTVIEVRDVTAEKRSEEATLKRSEQLRRLAEVASRIGLAHDVTSVMGIVTEETRHVIESHQSVASINADQNWAQSINTVSLSEKYAQWRDYDQPPNGSGIYTLVCHSNQPLRLTQAELEAHPAWRQFSGEAENHPPMRGWLAAPFVGPDGRNLGLIQLSDKCEGDFNEDDEAVLVQLARMASVALENARLVESLKNADRRKDEFLATLAHELRNPLAPIRMGLEAMKLGVGDAAINEEIRGMMERQTLQLIALVDDLLDVSRITRGKLELRKCRVKLADVIRSAVEASRPFITEAGHQLSVTLPDRPMEMEADPNRLAQVISNLLNNAAKYTPEGGRIWLSAEWQGSDVCLSVRDTGIGIPADMQQRIFEMFAQIDRPMERGYTGLGIGLTLVRSLVDMHGGRVEVQSEGVNQGSEFRVRLPMLVEQTRPESNLISAEGEGQKSGHRILVVDDNKAAADLLAMVVRLLGNEVWMANDGQQAVEMAEQYRPDVILMDIGMPRLNGYDAARQIRQQPWGERILLIALTGWGQDEDRRLTREAGFDHHLIKPADPTELQRLLVEHPQRKS